MGRVINNGLHWNSPVDSTPRDQYNAGQGFSAAFILASGNITYGATTTFYNNWQDEVRWVNQSGKRHFEIVLRLYWPKLGDMSGNPGNPDDQNSLANKFYTEIVRPGFDLGVRNFQVLNEINVEYEPNKPRSLLGGDMYNIAYTIKLKAQSEGRSPVYLGFPGPGNNPYDITWTDPVLQYWQDYWNFYRYYITLGAPGGPAYNWLGVHCYEYAHTSLNGRMKGQYLDLIGRIANYPMRWTEYGIPIDVNQYCPISHPPGTPYPGCPNAQPFQNRANDYA